MIAPRRHPGCNGFTLIEVLVAITILGISYAATLGAFSGSIRLLRQATEHQNAMLLARSRLEETLIDTRMDIHGDDAEDKYNGVAYAYRIEIRDLPLIEPELKEKVKLPIRLEEITVNVYWGPAGKENNYRLTAYRTSPAEAAQPPGQPGTAPEPGATPASGAPGAPAPVPGKQP